MRGTALPKAWFSYAANIPGTEPPTGLGHHYSICEHLSPNHYLSQALTASLPAKLRWVQLRRQAGSRWRLSGMKIFHVNIICGYNEWRNISIFPTIPHLQMEWLKIASIQFALGDNLSMSAIHRRCTRDPLEQITKRCHLQPATTSQVGQLDMRTRL